jgi:hypothetical protein
MSLLEGDGIPLPLLYHINTTFASWACWRINTLWMANVAFDTTLTTNISLVVLQSLKQTTQYNKYCIWNLKPKIEINLNMALLEFIDHESILIHGKNANLPMLHRFIRCIF